MLPAVNLRRHELPTVYGSTEEPHVWKTTIVKQSATFHVVRLGSTAVAILRPASIPDLDGAIYRLPWRIRAFVVELGRACTVPRRRPVVCESPRALGLARSSRGPAPAAARGSEETSSAP